MRLMRLALCAWCCALAAAHTPAAPLPRLRGGATTLGFARTRPAPRSLIPTVQDEMSDAERVFVVQQFARAAVRKAFLKKVFIIVALQCAATGGLIALVRLLPMLFFSLRRLGPLLMLSPLAPLLWMQLSPSARTQWPLNALLLSAYTVMQGLTLGVATAGLPGDLLLRAAGVCAVATGSLSVYALQTKRDFTARGGMLTSGLMGLLALGLLQAIVGGPLLLSAKAYFGCLLFSGYLIYDVQQIMGGGKAVQFRPDEHVSAALSLYVDILNFFLNILLAMASRENER